MFHGYLIVLATFLMKFSAIGTELSAAMYLLPFQTTFNASHSTASLLESIYCSVGLFSSLFAGTIQSFFSSYYGEVHSVKPVFILGGICIALGSYLASFGGSLTQVLLYSIITSVGIGLAGYTCSGVCVQWFEQKNRGQMLLLALTGNGVGSFTYTNVLGDLLQKISSSVPNTNATSNGEGSIDAWRLVMRYTGAVTGLIVILASLFLMRLPYPLEVELHEHNENEENDIESNYRGGMNILDTIVDDESESSEGTDEKFYDSFTDPFNLQLTVESEEDQSKDQIDAIFDSKNDDMGDSSNIIMASNDVNTFDELQKETLNDEHQNLDVETKPLLKKRGNQKLTLSLTASRSMRAMSFLNNISILSHNHSDSSSHQNLYDIAGSLAEVESLRELPIDRSSMIQSMKLETKLSLSKAIHTRTTLSILSSTIFLSFGLMPFLEYLPAFAESIGLSEDQATSILALSGLAMITGSIVFGFAVNQFGPIWMLRFLLLILTSLILAWPHCYDATSLRLLTIIYGSCTTVSFNLGLVILTNAFGSASPTTILHLSGLMNVIATPGYLLGPSIVGYLYDLNGNYISGSLFAGAVIFLSFVSVCFVPHPDVQKKRLGIE